MVPDHFSSTNDLIQGIERFIKENGAVNHKTFNSPLDTGSGRTLHMIHRLDESSSDSGTTKRIDRIGKADKRAGRKSIDCNVIWMSSLKAIAGGMSSLPYQSTLSFWRHYIR